MNDRREDEEEFNKNHKTEKGGINTREISRRV